MVNIDRGHILTDVHAEPKLPAQHTWVDVTTRLRHCGSWCARISGYGDSVQDGEGWGSADDAQVVYTRTECLFSLITPSPSPFDRHRPRSARSRRRRQRGFEVERPVILRVGVHCNGRVDEQLGYHAEGRHTYLEATYPVRLHCCIFLSSLHCHSRWCLSTDASGPGENPSQESIENKSGETPLEVKVHWCPTGMVQLVVGSKARYVAARNSNSVVGRLAAGSLDMRERPRRRDRLRFEQEGALRSDPAVNTRLGHTPVLRVKKNIQYLMADGTKTLLVALTQLHRSSSRSSDWIPWPLFFFLDVKIAARSQPPVSSGQWVPQPFSVLPTQLHTAVILWDRMENHQSNSAHFGPNMLLVHADRFPIPLYPRVLRRPTYGHTKTQAPATTPSRPQRSVQWDHCKILRARAALHPRIMLPLCPPLSLSTRRAPAMDNSTKMHSAERRSTHQRRALFSRFPWLTNDWILERILFFGLIKTGSQFPLRSGPAAIAVCPEQRTSTPERFCPRISAAFRHRRTRPSALRGHQMHNPNSSDIESPWLKGWDRCKNMRIFPCPPHLEPCSSSTLHSHFRLRAPTTGADWTDSGRCIAPTQHPLAVEEAARDTPGFPPLVDILLPLAAESPLRGRAATFPALEAPLRQPCNIHLEPHDVPQTQITVRLLLLRRPRRRSSNTTLIAVIQLLSALAPSHRERLGVACHVGRHASTGDLEGPDKIQVDVARVFPPPSHNPLKHINSTDYAFAGRLEDSSFLLAYDPNTHWWAALVSARILADSAVFPASLTTDVDHRGSGHHAAQQGKMGSGFLGPSSAPSQAFSRAPKRTGRALVLPAGRFTRPIRTYDKFRHTGNGLRLSGLYSADGIKWIAIAHFM
ncbi:hypothetical protein B0H16DRAFT_1452221 [Mycena metata]|uniref:Uncharacterized protein n=1 Tax=Mycena metata TaxID=1033252 RepID=A0AAD7JQF8_9AGAR|nr:hypothetical protein B0H16DRAFT_1452221 [Mycena metata]